MGTTAPGPIHLLDIYKPKHLDFVCNVDDKDSMWLKENEKAERMFISEFMIKEVVEISPREKWSAELHLRRHLDGLPPCSVPAPAIPPAFPGILTSEEESTPKKSEAGHSYLERLLNVEVPQKVGLEQEPIEKAESEETAEEPEVSKNSGCISKSHSATDIVISTPTSKSMTTGQATAIEEHQEAKLDQTDGHREPAQSVRKKQSYKQAMSEPDEELQPPWKKTPSSPCPANKVVPPLRTFSHTVQKKQMLMTSTLGSHSSVMKSFIKCITPLRVHPKEKERPQRLENLQRKKAEHLHRQKLEEDKRPRLEEVKMKHEERFRKVLQARQRKTEKAKGERLAEKDKKKAAAMKMEEVEVGWKEEEEEEEEEECRLRWLQQVFPALFGGWT
ncbi:inner centromere [Sigmodon hispidus]